MDGWIVPGCYHRRHAKQLRLIPVGHSQPAPLWKHTQVRNRSQTWYCQLPDTDIENLIGQQYGMQIGQTTVENIFDPLDPLCGLMQSVVAIGTIDVHF